MFISVCTVWCGLIYDEFRTHTMQNVIDPLLIDFYNRVIKPFEYTYRLRGDNGIQFRRGNKNWGIQGFGIKHAIRNAKKEFPEKFDQRSNGYIAIEDNGSAYTHWIYVKPHRPVFEGYFEKQANYKTELLFLGIGILLSLPISYWLT